MKWKCENKKQLFISNKTFSMNDKSSNIWFIWTMLDDACCTIFWLWTWIHNIYLARKQFLLRYFKSHHNNVTFFKHPIRNSIWTIFQLENFTYPVFCSLFFSVAWPLSTFRNDITNPDSLKDEYLLSCLVILCLFII